MRDPMPSAESSSPAGGRVPRWMRQGAGVVLVSAGAAMLVLPGPGLLTVAAGVALIRGQRSSIEAAAD